VRYLLIFVLAFFGQSAHAANATFTHLKTLSVVELNTILQEERQAFMQSSSAQAPYAIPKASRAVNAVDIYTVEYDSFRPELGQQPVRASGLLALPKSPSTGMPLMAYQHGTVFGKYEVPSYAFQQTNPSGSHHYPGAYETRYMVALFAGNGFALMAADYFGMGVNAHEPEAYFVKGSTQQANYDLLLDVQGYLKGRGMAPTDLFLGGWSQGGLNTTGFLQKLESENVPVRAAFTASAPSDPYAALNGLLYFPRPGRDAPWLNTILALTVFSYQTHFKQPQLAESVIEPEFLPTLKAIYDRSYASEAELMTLLAKLGQRPLLNYLKPAYQNPAHFAHSTYGQLLRQNETYRHLFKTPLHMFYGTRDEVIKEAIATLPSHYQQILIGNAGADRLSAIKMHRIAGADHRATFITAAPRALAWMQPMQPKQGPGSRAAQ
jgi:hypothetical protein